MLTGQSKLKQLVVEATVTRADGSVEAPQVVAYWHESLVKRLAWKLATAKRRKAALVSSNQKDK